MKRIMVVGLVSIAFISQSEARRLKYLDYHILSWEELCEREYSRILPEGIYVLHHGRVYFIKNALGKFKYGPEEFLEKEVFIYKLAQRCSISNVAEVKMVNSDKIKGTELGEWLKRNGFSQALLTRLAEEYKDPITDRSPSWREELVAFWVFVRDFDHWIKGVDTNFYCFSSKGEIFGISYDSNRALLADPKRDILEFIEEGSALFWLISAPEFSYVRLSEVVKRIISLSDDEIKDLALESGFPEETAERVVRYLRFTRGNLLRDLEYLITEIRKESVNKN
jgi:hypothetical protein